MKKGLVHIYTGDGKGKTTAALGLALRAAGSDYKVCFFQFFKAGKFPCGEMNIAKKLGKNFKCRRLNISHPLFKKVSASKVASQLRKALYEVEAAIKNPQFDIVVLDEVLNGASQGFMNEGLLEDIIRRKPAGLELVLTGRGATKKLIACADYVTHMKEIKHPFSKGIKARKGIEF